MSNIYGRESQYSSLRAALKGYVLPQSLMIWGPPSSGKSLVLDTILTQGQCGIRRVARINSIEIMCGKRPFFETILKQLWGNEEGEVERHGKWKCDNVALFVRRMKELYYRPGTEESNSVVVIEEAEHLKDSEPELLDIVVRLQEFSVGNICVVLVSNVAAPMAFTGINNMRNTLSIHFPQYTKEEIINIIVSCSKPEEADQDTFSAYVGMVINVFYGACRDLRKLSRLVLSNWELIKDQKKSSLHSVWKDIVPRLKDDFKILSSHFLPMQQSNKDCEEESDRKGKGSLTPANINNNRVMSVTPSAGTGNQNSSSSKPESKSSCDMPLYSKYILIASYLATNNPPASDKRFFVKASTRKTTGKRTFLKKNTRSREDQEENSGEKAKLNSGRSFDQNRLKSIFACLVTYCSNGEEHFEGNVDWCMQISSLCQSQYLHNLGEDTSGNIKYRCLADYDFIHDLSTSVNFELDKHLFRLL